MEATETSTLDTLCELPYNKELADVFHKVHCKNANGFSPAYSALGNDHIRLLRLLPSELETEIRCELVQYALSDAPVYDAVSYAWGSGVPERDIMLNGHRIRIGKNL